MKAIRPVLLACVLATAVLGVGGSAEADSGGELLLAETISKCFHPAAEFVTVEWTTPRVAGPTKSFQKDGVVTYSPKASTFYRMPFTVEMQRSEERRVWRVLVDGTQDTGANVEAPAAACHLRAWQSLKP